MAEKTKKTNKYEAMFLLGAGVAAEVEKSIALVKGVIEKHGGSILVIKKWDERKLSYEVKGQKRGLYIITYFTALGTAVASIERDVNLSEEMLRVLVTDAEHLTQAEMDAVEPQPIQPKEERPSWDRPYENAGGGGGGGRDRGDRGDRGGDRGGDRPPRAPRAEVPAGADKD